MKKNTLACLLMFLLGTTEVMDQIIVLGDLTHDYSLDPGGHSRGTIVLQNAGNQDEPMRIYQRDYFFIAEGRISYGEPGVQSRSNASWIKFSPQILTLVPGEKQEVNFEITVPDDSSLVGSYWSMIMIEGQPESGGVERGLNIRVVTRYGIQIVTTIGLSGKIFLNFFNPKILFMGERRMFDIDIENNGNRQALSEIWVELFSSAGKSVGRFPSVQRRIYPGTSIRAEMDISEVPADIYQAIVVADCGDENLFGTNLTLEVK